MRNMDQVLMVCMKS